MRATTDTAEVSTRMASIRLAGTVVDMIESPRITIGVPMETADGERRVALVPDAVAKLVARGVDVVVAPGAGAAALIPDDLYLAAGAAFDRDPWGCDIVLKVAPPTLEEVARLHEGAVLIGLLTPWAAPELQTALDARDVRAFAMESRRARAARRRCRRRRARSARRAVRPRMRRSVARTRRRT